MGQQQSSQILEICVDLDFDNYMSHKEIKSLVDQVRYCYSYNRRAEVPSRLLIAGCSSKTWKLMKERDARLWNTEFIELYKQPIDEILSNVVYLTADASETLEKIDYSCTYVIGGIVDRNRHKNLCYEKAIKLGMRVARLPLQEHIDLSMSPVLTVNQVFAIMLDFNRTGNWNSLKTSIPQRRQEVDDN